MEDVNMEREIEISVSEGKYTFVIYKGDYKVYCLRYGQVWMVFERGYRAIASLLREFQDLRKKQ